MPLVVRARLCTGCRTCELACAFAHGAACAPGGPASPGGYATPGASRVHVTSDDPLHLPLLCLQCDDAACMRACPTRALVRNEITGAVELAGERCIRCEACVIACPFGNIRISAGAMPQKCDLCGGDPACARFCPSGALWY
ncbi:MAG: 4Fe-4S dicluster domain-containing protein [Planctomycetes bacterium]|nr:4Fe-4S dicluster domain-containing protein [Planctomycetota bacterium]